MHRLTCTFCDSTHAVGYLFNDETLRICRMCRDSVLTYLDSIGIIIADTHPFIRELCVNSHYVYDACWSFHNHLTGTNQRVIRLAKPVDNFADS